MSAWVRLRRTVRHSRTYNGVQDGGYGTKRARHGSPLLAHFKIVDTLCDMLAALMGYRGCGKTTIGKRIADRLWARFVDIDDRIVRAAGGKSIRDIFLEYGE